MPFKNKTINKISKIFMFRYKTNVDKQNIKIKIKYTNKIIFILLL